MASLHTLLGWPLALLCAVVGVWAMVANWVEGARRRELWITITVSQVLIFVQAFLGVIALSGFDGAEPGLHIFYGFLAMLGVGILYAYRTYDGLNEHRYLLYGLGSLFISGLLLRAITLRPEAALGPLW